MIMDKKFLLNNGMILNNIHSKEMVLLEEEED
jgi:hypothetical protein